MRASVIIPAYNAQAMIAACLQALNSQDYDRSKFEIIVVDDGSTDRTADIVGSFSDVRLIKQHNQGPAAARNNGANTANGDIILFTDSDCEPYSNWVREMIAPFEREPGLTGVKGTYQTRQKQLVARFVQLEYEDKYDILKKIEDIDFIDTYSAGFRRDTFLKYGGYDSTFKVACAEDVELSYRMANGGEKMKFIPAARVYHLHPASLLSYLRKKYKFAYWRILALKKNPNKAVKDSHTPQMMKAQLLFPPALLGSLAVAPFISHWVLVHIAVWFVFLLTTLPFMAKAMAKDFTVAVISPFLLLGRSIAQFLGVCSGTVQWLVKPGK